MAPTRLTGKTTSRLPSRCPFARRGLPREVALERRTAACLESPRAWFGLHPVPESKWKDQSRRPSPCRLRPQNSCLVSHRGAGCPLPALRQGPPEPEESHRRLPPPAGDHLVLLDP